jgi:HAD superfamily hydrolase (TIGR01509 family)
MAAFYFDVGGVLISDQLAPANAINLFRKWAPRYNFNPDSAHATYTRLQPSLDLGVTSLNDLCTALGVEEQAFVQDWLALHPVNHEVIKVIERLIVDGHSVGLATNFLQTIARLADREYESTGKGGGLLFIRHRADKPSAEFYRRANDLIGSNEVVFVDDRRVNVDAARRVGWTAIEATDGWLVRFKGTYLAYA